MALIIEQKELSKYKAKASGFITMHYPILEVHVSGKIPKYLQLMECRRTYQEASTTAS